MTKKLQDKARVTTNNCFEKVFGKWGIFSVSREFVSRNLTTWGGMRRNAVYSLLCRVANCNNDIISASQLSITVSHILLISL